MKGGKVVENQELNVQLEKFRNGSEEAFREIYEELKTPVYTIIYRILYDRLMAEDVMQEVFLKISQTPPPSKVKKSRAWIFQVSRNLAIDYKRKERETKLLSEETEATSFSLENTVNTRVDVESALKVLPEEEREIVTLRLNAELKFKDIAELLKTPLGTVLWRYRKAISQMQKELTGRENETDEQTD